MAAGGPPRTKGNAPLEPSQHREPMASSSSKHVGKAQEALPSHGTPKSKSKDKETPVISKHQSMRIHQARFVDTSKGKGERSGAKVVVMVDDNESDEGDAVET
ncbi:hypothetical protein L3X38_017448 [Prunus dulcis]|uniref:Uncharacterized protein n=1 Tax=Prunus dulcis TaxID=3755 RepID=A0AAD4W9U8_PRUDU|nr:hypothetical protein L3X38_017448 [Prunus dulcis]